MDKDTPPNWLSHDQWEDLKNGKTVELLIEKRSDKSVDVLEVEWTTKGSMYRDVEEEFPELFHE